MPSIPSLSVSTVSGAVPSSDPPTTCCSWLSPFLALLLVFWFYPPKGGIKPKTEQRQVVCWLFVGFTATHKTEIPSIHAARCHIPVGRFFSGFTALCALRLPSKPFRFFRWFDGLGERVKPRVVLPLLLRERASLGQLRDFSPDFLHAHGRRTMLDRVDKLRLVELVGAAENVGDDVGQ